MGHLQSTDIAVVSVGTLFAVKWCSIYSWVPKKILWIHCCWTMG